MSVIDILTRVDAICQKYDKYDVDKQKDSNVSGDDAFARLYSVVLADIESSEQKAEAASKEKNRASAVAMNAEIRRTKARLLEEVPKLQRLAMKRMANTSTLSLRSILEKENVLLGSNYLDWYRKLKIVLRHERKIYVLEDEPMKEPAPDASEENQSYYSRYMEDALDVHCIMMSSMSPELQRQHENMSAREIDQHLRELFQESARVERYETSRALFRTMLVEGNQVGPHVLKMIGYIERLESLGVKLDQDLAVDLVLSSLPPSFSQFVLNFNMNSMDKSLTDLMTMLKTAEKDMKVNPSLRAMMVRKTNKRPGTGKFNPKANAVKNPGYQAQKKLKKGQQVPQSDEKEAACFHCGKKGHWKKNCYSFMKKSASGANASGSK